MQIRRSVVAGLSIVVALAVSAGSAWAHHSYVMFDRTKVVTVKGTVAKLEWQNPHVWLWLYVANDKGGYDTWAFETGSVMEMSRLGWKKDFLKAGDELTVQTHQLKNGQTGGYFVKAMRPDGAIILPDPVASSILPGEKERAAHEDEFHLPPPPAKQGTAAQPNQ